MGVSEDLTARLKQAMKDKDQVALAAVRSLKNAIMTEERKGTLHELSEEEKLGLVRRQIKQRQESIEVYRDKGRQDLADKEEAELRVLEAFLPRALSQEELLDLAREAVAQSGAGSLKELGKAMRLAREKAAGRADGKALADAVKALLS